MTFKLVISFIYVIVFFTAICGNALLIIAVSRNKKLRMAVYILLANVSLSDLFFASLSLVDAVYYLMDNWVFSETFCRMQGAFMEVFYTVSTLSLTAVAIERYFSICYLEKAKRSVDFYLKCISLIWILSLVVCSPLFYGYSTSQDSTSWPSLQNSNIKVDNNTTASETIVICTNKYWSPGSGIAFYSVHTALIYVLPLVVMLMTHSRITFELRKRRKQTKVCQQSLFAALAESERKLFDTNRFSRAIFDMKAMKLVKDRARNIKIIKLLVVLTSLFFVLWTPFIVTRIMRFTSIVVPHTVWKLVQLLILASTAVNFFIYASMSTVLRRTFLSFLPCMKRWQFFKVMDNETKADLSGYLQDNYPSDIIVSSQ